MDSRNPRQKLGNWQVALCPVTLLATRNYVGRIVTLRVVDPIHAVVIDCPIEKFLEPLAGVVLALFRRSSTVCAILNYDGQKLVPSKVERNARSGSILSVVVHDLSQVRMPRWFSANRRLRHPSPVLFSSD
jgi:hypothetical protein